MLKLAIIMALTLPIAACSSADTEHYVALLTGTPDPSPQAYVAPVAEVEQTSAPVAVVQPPHVPQCWWQAWQWYYCDGVYVEPQPHNPNF